VLRLRARPAPPRPVHRADESYESVGRQDGGRLHGADQKQSLLQTHLDAVSCSRQMFNGSDRLPLPTRIQVRLQQRSLLQLRSRFRHRRGPADYDLNAGAGQV